MRIFFRAVTRRDVEVAPLCELGFASRHYFYARLDTYHGKFLVIFRVIETGSTAEEETTGGFVRFFHGKAAFSRPLIPNLGGGVMTAEMITAATTDETTDETTDGVADHRPAAAAALRMPVTPSAAPRAEIPGAVARCFACMWL